MKQLTRFLFIAGLCLTLNPLALAADTNKAAPLDWREHNLTSFQQARQQDKFLLLDLLAVWCHWCHVMEASTYEDPAVIALLREHFVVMKADHDARPDLAERYRDWGWPATIIYAPDGTELVKRAGYISPSEMRVLLQNLIDDPAPQGSHLNYPENIKSTPELDAATRKALSARHVRRFDYQQGGLDIGQKFIERDSLAWDLTLAAEGDAAAEERARLTLDGALNLIDPVFGGAYQYSTHGDWKHPHYEKIMRVQSRYVALYVQAGRQLNEPRYLQAAQAIVDYMLEFLSAPEGGFYNSQDADLEPGKKAHTYYTLDRETRLAQGLPRIAPQLYASASGYAIDALLQLYQVTTSPVLLQRAEQALVWVFTERRLGQSGFRHDRVDTAGPYLMDNLAMVRALLTYHQVTGDKQALQRAVATTGFIGRYLKHPKAGLVSAADNGTPLQPLPQLDENITAAQLLLELYAVTGQPQLKALAEHTLRYLNSPEVALSRITEAGLLLLDKQYRALSPDLAER